MPSPSLTLLRTQTDDRLAALAREGHERAFEAIVERYRRPLLRAARRVLPEARAEDALQQALISAWRALQRGDDVRDLRAWLYRVVHNTALNQLRVSGYDYDDLEDALRIADAGDDELERRAVVRQTLASLAALPERQRQALLRTAVSGYSQEEVARDLGISENAMRQLIHRARVSMRAAATALTPAPLVTAAASAARGGPAADRIAELAAGAAPAGAAATLAKAGTAVVLAGSALTGPAIVDRVADRPQRDATAAAATVPGASRSGRSAAAPDGDSELATPVGAAPAGRGGSRRAPMPGSERGRRRTRERGSGASRVLAGPGRRGRAEDRSGRGGDRDRPSHSGSGSGDDSSGHREGDDRSPSSGPGSGSGGSGSGSSGPGSGGSGSSGFGEGGSSGSGGGGPSSSGSGSGGSGSGSSGSASSGSSGSGSGSSGSGGSGPGDGGSGPSGSGSSGSGDGGSSGGSDHDALLPTPSSSGDRDDRSG